MKKINIGDLIGYGNDKKLVNEKSKKFHASVNEYTDRVFELLKNKKYENKKKTFIRKKVKSMLYQIKKQEIAPSNDNINFWLNQIKESIMENINSN